MLEGGGGAVELVKEQELEISAEDESAQLKQIAENGDVVGVYVDGGLDSKTVALKLRLACVQVKCFAADIGQPVWEDVRDVVKKMYPCGFETVIVDLKKDIAEAAFEAIACQTSFDGDWPSTSIGRYVTVRGLLQAMKQHGCTVFALGAAGRGQDQMLFARYANAIDPTFKMYAPWRDPTFLAQFPGRSHMLSFIQGHGIDHKVVSQSADPCATDANICGLRNEADNPEPFCTSMAPVKPIMGVWPKDAPDSEETVTLRFKRGRCVAINGAKLDPLQLLETANRIAGRNGVGIGQASEKHVVGTKSRAVFEAPGMELFGRGLAYVYQAVHDRRSVALFNRLSRRIVDQICDGRYFDSSTRVAIGHVWELAELACGTVQIGLYKGHMHFLALTHCPHRLLFDADPCMEFSEVLHASDFRGDVDFSSVDTKSMAKVGLIDVGSLRKQEHGKSTPEEYAKVPMKATCGYLKHAQPCADIICSRSKRKQSCVQFACSPNNREPCVESTCSPKSHVLLQGLRFRNLERIDNYSAGELNALLEYSRRLKSLAAQDELPGNLLFQESLAMIFQKCSTRTRVSAETGMSMLGGHSLVLPSQGVHLEENESVESAACAFSGYQSLVMASVSEHEVVKDLCEHCDVPVINAVSDMHYPLQILADFMTLQEHLGSYMWGKKLAWIGDGSNILHDIMLGAPMLGLDLHIATPKGYEPKASIVVDAQKLAVKHGCMLCLTNKPEEVVYRADVVITSAWASTGPETEARQRLRDFAGFKVTRDLMQRGGAKSGWRFLHCLPRHPEEVDDEVFNSQERSLVFDGAENRMWTSMAVLSTMLGKIA